MNDAFAVSGPNSDFGDGLETFADKTQTCNEPALRTYGNGGYVIRTRDLYNAIVALSQLS